MNENSESQAAELRQGLGCLSVLLQHMNLLDDEGCRGSFSLRLLTMSDYLHYDASAAKALSVFPEAKVSHRSSKNDDYVDKLYVYMSATVNSNHMAHGLYLWNDWMW